MLSKITSYLNKVKDYNSVIGKITFDKNGQNMVPLITRFVVQDGKWKIWEMSEYADNTRLLNR